MQTTTEETEKKVFRMVAQLPVLPPNFRVRPHSYNDYRTPYEARYGLNQFRQLRYKNA